MPGTVDEVTGALTDEVPSAVEEVAVVGPVVGPVLDDPAGADDDPVTGPVDDLGDDLDQTTGSLLD